MPDPKNYIRQIGTKRESTWVGHYVQNARPSWRALFGAGEDVYNYLRTNRSTKPDCVTGAGTLLVATLCVAESVPYAGFRNHAENSAIFEFEVKNYGLYPESGEQPLRMIVVGCKGLNVNSENVPIPACKVINLCEYCGTVAGQLAIKAAHPDDNLQWMDIDDLAEQDRQRELQQAELHRQQRHAAGWAGADMDDKGELTLRDKSPSPPGGASGSRRHGGNNSSRAPANSLAQIAQGMGTLNIGGRSPRQPLGQSSARQSASKAPAPAPARQLTHPTPSSRFFAQGQKHSPAQIGTKKLPPAGPARPKGP
ncbi:hypothetical protein N658DRAFT_488726 [Parathielavia hyrcaniae]|uniref:Uncharacterized protein n=1 Tax=Parathielavia hyrcaniae TaxID=113614 RepID=A0AAN6PVZ4_9PEZI|nr:hypothetical protein N658DRAFT_488726 [Parathielavia hyrcaniae]